PRGATERRPLFGALRPSHRSARPRLLLVHAGIRLPRPAPRHRCDHSRRGLRHRHALAVRPDTSPPARGDGRLALGSVEPAEKTPPPGLLSVSGRGYEEGLAPPSLCFREGAFPKALSPSVRFREVRTRRSDA